MNVPDTNPVFILGMNGSGTTMLLDCLNNHPELYGFRGETRVIPHFISTIEKYGDLTNDSNFYSMWDDFRNTPILVSCNDGIPPPIPKDWRNRERSLSNVINSVFTYFASLDSKSRWCEKTPMHALHITSLHEVFPAAKFIHVIRDGRDCAASFHRRWGYSVMRTMCRWKAVVPIAQSQGKEIPNQYMELRYEDLTLEPELWMRKTCEFLDIEFDPKILMLSRNQKHSGSNQKNISPNSEKWRTYYSQKALEKLELIAGKQLSTLSYSVQNPNGDHNPNKLFRAYWALNDHARAIFRKIKSEDNRTKYNFKAQLIAAIKQTITNKPHR